MKKRLVAAFAVLAPALGLGFPGSPLKHLVPERMNETYPGLILVKYTQDEAARIQSSQILRMIPPSPGFPGAEYVSRIGPSGWIMYRVPKGTDVKALAATVKPGGKVVSAQPVNRIYPLLVTPNDADWGVIETSEDLIFNSTEDEHSFKRLWNLDDVNAFAGWSVWPNRWYTAANKPRDAVSMAIIDTGCDMNHPDFINAGGTSADSALGGQLDYANSRQFRLGEVDPNGTPMDTHGHGTHVAGLAVAAGNNGGYMGHGMIGTGYPSKAMILRVFDASGNGSDADAAAAIYWAADKGAAVINLSLGTRNYSQLFQDAVTYAFQKGSLVIAAGNESGNGGGDLGPIYPAACSGAFAVTANGPDYVPAVTNYTGIGSYLSMAAPGGDVVIAPDFTWFKIQYDFSTTPTYPVALNDLPINPPIVENYSYLVGTSMAAPMVAGAASLWYGRFKQSQASGWANIRAAQTLARSAQSVMGAPNGGWEPYQGFGVLDMESLLLQGNPRSATVGSIQGIVYYNGTAIANVPVKAKRLTSPVVYSTTTGPDGTYRFDQLPPWNYTVWAAPFGSYKQRHLNVQAGCDMPGIDLWSGTFTGDTTAPVVAKARAHTVGTNNITVDHFAYDTETGIDKTMIQIGDMQGGNSLLRSFEIWPRGSNFFYFGQLNFKVGITYWCRLTYTNGAGLTTFRDFSFQRPR